MTNTNLPPHIRQLVEKNNFVIAIKTLAQEQGISLEEAKAQIDAYENQQKSQSKPTDDFQPLVQSLDNHLKQQNIKLPLLPYWAKRLLILLFIILIFGIFTYQLFY